MGALPTVLMGDPSYFRIRSGSNPHTRTRWGFRKKVDLPRAVRQWHTLAKCFTDLGVRVIVLPPSRENPGSVFPANAGFLYPKLPLGRVPLFYLSNLTPGRGGERPLYEEFLNRLGFQTGNLPYPFEGEADFIETSEGFLFTSGPILKQRFIPSLGFPPYRRLYGFRSDERNLGSLKEIVDNERIFPLTLVSEWFYHGDTVLFPFGVRKEYLLAYLPALASESQKLLLDLFGERLLPLEREDAIHFAANGFQVETGGIFHLILPEGLSTGLLQSVERRGVKTLTVDVSEFSEKGGGSVKCLLCDLGSMDLENPLFPEDKKDFWRERSYPSLYS